MCTFNFVTNRMATSSHPLTSDIAFFCGKHHLNCLRKWQNLVSFSSHLLWIHLWILLWLFDVAFHMEPHQNISRSGLQPTCFHYIWTPVSVEHKCWFKQLFCIYCKYILTIYNYVYYRIKGLCAYIPINYMFCIASYCTHKLSFNWIKSLDLCSY